MSETEPTQALLTPGDAAEKMWIDVPENCHYEDSSMPTSAPDADAEVAIRHWRPKDTASLRGVLVIFHGLHSHSGRWARVAEVMAANGYAVYVPDHILHGRSSPEGLPVCDISDFGIFVADARALIQRVSDAHPELPVFVLGHSMGSIIAMHAMHMNTAAHGRVKGVIYSGLALNPGPSSAAPMGMKCLFCLIKGCCGLCLGGCLAGCGPMAGECFADRLAAFFHIVWALRMVGLLTTTTLRQCHLCRWIHPRCREPPS